MLYTVDPKKVIVNLGGVPIAGWAEDQLSIEYDEDLFNEMVGCTGEVARAHINNRTGTCKLNLLQTSQSNDTLSTLYLRDVAGNAGVVPFEVRDVNGTTLVKAAMAYVKKPAKVDSGKSVKVREWTLRVIDLDMFIGGNTAAI